MNKYNVIEKFVGMDSYIKGKSIPSYQVRYIGNVVSKDVKEHHFRVASQSNHGFYSVYVHIYKNELTKMHCDCPRFKEYGTCKHVAASLFKHFDDLIKEVDPAVNFLSDYITNEKECYHKELLKLDLEFEFNEDTIEYKAKIGTKKTYLLTKSKGKDFISAYKNNEIYIFGKNFTYDPQTQEFNSQDKKILDFLFNYTNPYSIGRYYYYEVNIFELQDRDFKALTEILQNKRFLITGVGYVNDIKTTAPKIFKLTFNDDYYTLKKKSKSYGIFLATNRYYYDNKTESLYILNNNINKILNKLERNALEELSFSEKEMPLFKKGLLKQIKSNLEVDPNIKSITLAKDIKTNLYFDIFEDLIKCKIKFNYDEEEINFYDETSNIIRDTEYENLVYQDLFINNFIKKDQEFVLADLDNIGIFLEEGLDNLSKKYNTYTSENLNKTNLFKKSRVESSFGIGKDGILSYSFKIDEVPKQEIIPLLNSLKAKKKYYKLKNGDILKLNDNQELLELENLVNDLELNSKDLKNNVVELPKYKAFYLESLKEEKYQNIKTNDLFDTFIENFKKYQNVKINFSKQDQELLRNYQKEGVKWLYTIYKCDFGGILADEMGLGKSFQTICFLKQVFKEKQDAKVLIVCPTSLVYNWQKEFLKYGEDIKYATVYDSKKQREEIFNNLDDYQVLITSYGLVRNDIAKYEQIKFEVCVIDEAQTIKNYQADMTKCVKKINAHTKIALSGTPIENSVLELWSIFDFIMPGYLNSIIKFKAKYQVKDIDENSLNILKNLNYQIKPFILRRLKKEVIKDLPDKLENIVYLDLPEVQKELYRKEVMDTKEKMNELIATKGYNSSQFEILKLLLRLREICIDPGMIYENYNEDVVKYQYLLNIVQSYIRDNHKIVIFSSFKKVIDSVKKLFDDNSITSYVIDGSVKGKMRVQLVDSFNKDNTNCFLITLKSGGTGLNLTSADIVIHLDIWWNPQAENQATDRTHRIGQTKNVTVVKLVTKGTIEEKILELQQKKKIVADNVMEGHSKQILNKISEEEMRDLLTSQI